MSTRIGNTEINKFYLGSTEIKKMYLGSDLVFEDVSETRPQLINSYSQVSNTLDVIVTASPTNGNYLIAQLALGNYSSDPLAPEGWTKIHETINDFGAHAFFAKESDGTETSITFSKTGGSGQIFMASVHEFLNVNDFAAYRDLQSSSRVQSTTINLPGLTSTNSSSLAVSFVTALNINDVEDSVTSLPSSGYTISGQYSSNLGQGAWNLLLTQECEDETLMSDSIAFSESAIHSTLNLVLNPTTANNLYPYSNAVGDDTDSYDQWNWSSSILVNSVASTDVTLGDNYAIRLEARNDGLTSSSLSHVITGLTDGVEYKATIRCRASITGGNTSDVFFNWNNVSNATYNQTVIGTDWEEVEILFTPTDSTSFTLKIYPFYNSGGNSLTGDFLEISSIIIKENTSSGNNQIPPFVGTNIVMSPSAANETNEANSFGTTIDSEFSDNGATTTIINDSTNVLNGSYAFQCISARYENLNFRPWSSYFTAGNRYRISAMIKTPESTTTMNMNAANCFNNITTVDGGTNSKVLVSNIPGWVADEWTHVWAEGDYVSGIPLIIFTGRDNNGASVTFYVDVVRVEDVT